MSCYGIIYPYPMKDDNESERRSEKMHNISACNLGDRIQRRNKHVNQRSRSSRIISLLPSGVQLILGHHYLILILGVSCIYEVSMTCLDYEMKLIGLERFAFSSSSSSSLSPSQLPLGSSSSAFASFMGRYGQLTNLLSFLFSYVVFPRLMDDRWGRGGLRRTLRIFPTLLLFVTILAYLVLPLNLPVLFVCMALLKATSYGINDPAKEILYMPTSNKVKFRAKFWIDAVGARFAKAIGSGFNAKAGSAENIVRYGGITGVVSGVTLWVVCYAAGLEFERLVAKGEIVGEGVEEENYDEMDKKCNEYTFIGNKSTEEIEGEISEWRSDSSIILSTSPPQREFD